VIEVAGKPVTAFSKTTAPVGVALPELFITCPLNVKLASTVPAIGEGEDARVVLVAIRVGLDHLLIKFATLTEPSPVARS
jgi:hypothetical protein